QPRAGAHVHATPSLTFERGARALHRAVDIVSGGIRNPRDHVAGGGVAHVQHRAGAGLDLAAIDEVAVDLDLDRTLLRGNVHASLPSIITALRFSAGSTRFSVCVMWALMIRAAPRPSRRCMASISATCSATSLAGSCPLRLATLTRTSRSACP